ncbi:MAG TPA: hypothetical protein VGS62_06940, partial [Streptosporangiaceae bacterium]|nr:hypothetical protein [Streptosporangiaceae bacterium]
LGWHPSVGAAVDAWIGHVMEAAGGEHEAAPDPETPLSEALHTLGQVRHMAGSMVMSENLTTRDCGRRILAALGDEPEEERNDEKG